MSRTASWITFLWLALSAVTALAQVPPQQTSITGHVQTLSGGQIDDTVVKFTLIGCGGFTPRVFSVTTVVSPNFTISPDPTGLVTGQAWGNDLLNCNGVTGGTRYQVQALTDGIPVAQPVCYQLVSTAPFNLDTAQPCPSPLPPFGTPTDAGYTNLTVSNVLTATEGIFTHINTPQAIDANTQPGADLGAQITAADAALGGSNSGTIVLNAGTITTPPTLSPGRVLKVTGPITWATKVTFPSNTALFCDGPAATIYANVNGTDAFQNSLIVASNSSNFDISGCHFDNANPTAAKPIMFAGLPASDVSIHNNSFHNLMIAAFNGTALSSQRLNISHNDVIIDNVTGDGVAINLFFFKGATVIGNTFLNVVHGVEGWGGNANGGWTPPGGSYVNGSAAQVNAATDLIATGNQCPSVGGACIWVSMVRRFNIGDNTSGYCGDLCYDSEGGAEGLIHDNFIQGSGNFAYGGFFQNEAVTFARNHAERASDNFNIIFVLKHSGGTTGPNHRVRLLDQDSYCATPCTAVYTEGFLDLDIEGGRTVNGNLNGINYNYNYTLRGVRMLWNVPTSGLLAVNIPQILGSSIVQVEDNEIIQQAGDAGGTGIVANWSDFNAIDTFNFYRNHVRGFGTDLSTSNSGLNVGPTPFPRMVTNVLDNDFDDGTLAHQLGMGGTLNDSYNVGPNRMNVPGNTTIRPLYSTPMPNNLRQVVTGVMLPTAASVGATRTQTFALPMALGDQNLFLNNGYSITGCSIVATSGAPQITATSLPDLSHLSVTIQAITAAAAQGTVTCTVSH